MEKKFRVFWCVAIGLFIFAIQLVFVEKTSAQTPEWLQKIQEVKIFRSTKNDVENLFKNINIIETYNYAEKEKDGWGKRINYETQYGELRVYYSTGECIKTNVKHGYNIKKDVVYSLELYPQTETNVDNLNYDLKKFKRIDVEDVGGAYELVNADLGIRIFVGDEIVESITFSHSASMTSYYCQK